MHISQFSFSGKVSYEELEDGVTQTSSVSPACLSSAAEMASLYSKADILQATVEKKNFF